MIWYTTRWNYWYYWSGTLGSNDNLSHGQSLGPLFDISEGNDDSESDRMFDSTLLGPEVGTIDGNLLGYINETNLGLPLSASESIEDGINDGLLDWNLDGLILGDELYLNRGLSLGFYLGLLLGQQHGNVWCKVDGTIDGESEQTDHHCK